MIIVRAWIYRCMIIVSASCMDGCMITHACVAESTLSGLIRLVISLECKSLQIFCVPLRLNYKHSINSRATATGSLISITPPTLMFVFYL